MTIPVTQTAVHITLIYLYLKALRCCFNHETSPRYRHDRSRLPLFLQFLLSVKHQSASDNKMFFPLAPHLPTSHNTLEDAIRIGLTSYFPVSGRYKATIELWLAGCG